MDDLTSPFSDPGSCPCSADLARLRADHEALRAALAEGVRTRRVTVGDAEGRDRIVLTAGAGGPEIVLAEDDGHARVRLSAQGEHGHVVVSGRTPDGPTGADLFALDAEDDDDRPYTGLELVDQGDSVAGLVVSEGARPHLWWAPEPDDD